MRLCAYAVRIISTTLIFSSVLYLYETYLIIPGKTFIVVLSAFLLNLIFILVLAVPLGMVFGINGIWIGFALAPVLTLTVCVRLMLRMYGREEFPLYIMNDGSVADYAVNAENIIAVRDAVADFLMEHNIFSGKVTRAMLIIEETAMLIVEQNEGRKIYAECTVKVLKDGRIDIIMRDDSNTFGITDADREISSLRSYVVANIMASHENRRSLMTTSLNRFYVQI